VASSPDGALVSTNEPAIFDAVTGEPHVELKGIAGSNGAAFSPDGTKLATGGIGGVLWDVATGRKLATFGSERCCLGVSFSPDGARIAGATFDDVVVWDAAPNDRGELREVARTNLGEVSEAIRFFGDSRRILLAGQGGTARIWTFNDHDRVPGFGAGEAAGGVFSEDGPASPRSRGKARPSASGMSPTGDCFISSERAPRASIRRFCHRTGRV
jgi:WD40 repeat protein